MQIELHRQVFKDLKSILHPSIIHKLKEKHFERKMKKQRYKKGFSDSDCWNLHYWLTDTLPKMIYNLRDMKHGAPEFEFEEFENLPLLWVNEQAQIYTNKLEKDAEHGSDYDYTDNICFWGGTIEDRCFCRWWIILTRIAWCLEQASQELEAYNEYKEEYERHLWGDSFDLGSMFEVADIDESGNPKSYRLKENEVDEKLKENYYNREKEIWKQKEAYKDEALDLLKKYFYNLWD